MDNTITIQQEMYEVKDMLTLEFIENAYKTLDKYDLEKMLAVIFGKKPENISK